MKKKIVILSIGAAVILILVSFTSVVGFQNNESDKKKMSPLYRIRTNKALNENIKDSLTCNYVGKGKLMLLLPSLEEKIKYLLDIDVSPEKIEELKQSIENNPQILNKLQIKGNEASSPIHQIFELLDISLESDSQPNGIEFNDKTAWTCPNWKECDCINKMALAYCIIGLLSFGTTFILLPIAILMFSVPIATIIFFITANNRCDKIPSLNS